MDDADVVVCVFVYVHAMFASLKVLNFIYNSDELSGIILSKTNLITNIKYSDHVELIHGYRKRSVTQMNFLVKC